MNTVRISEEAEADLDAIWLYIAEDSLLNADQFLDRVVATFTTTLSTAPLAGRTRDEFELDFGAFQLRATQPFIASAIKQ